MVDFAISPAITNGSGPHTTAVRNSPRRTSQSTDRSINIFDSERILSSVGSQSVPPSLSPIKPARVFHRLTSALCTFTSSGGTSFSIVSSTSFSEIFPLRSSSCKIR